MIKRIVIVLILISGTLSAARMVQATETGEGGSIEVNRNERPSLIQGEERGDSIAETQPVPMPVESVGSDVPDKGCRFCPPEEILKKWRESFGQPPKH